MGMEESIAAMQQQIKTLFEADKANKATQQSICDLVVELKVMNSEMRELRKDIDKFGTDLETLRCKPAHRWESVVQTLITAVASGFAAYVLLQLGLK